MIKSGVVATSLMVIVMASQAANAAGAAKNWSGAYAGASVGFGEITAKQEFPTYIELYGDNTDNIGFGAVQAGYNWNIGTGMIVGVEVDYAFGDISTEGPLRDDVAPWVGEWWPTKLSGEATLRARFGMNVTDSTMAYVAGGVARAKLKGDIYDEMYGIDYRESYSKNLLGWTVGLGFDSALTDRLSFRGEYRHTRYRDEDFNLSDTIPFSSEVRTNEVRVGVNYSF